MIQRKLGILFFLYLSLFSFSHSAEGFTIQGKEFVYRNESLDLRIDQSGNLVSYILKGRNYEREFISAAIEAGTETEIETPDWLATLCGIRFGIPGSLKDGFNPVQSKILEPDTNVLSITLEDLAKDSPVFGLRIEKIWKVSQEKNQLELEIRLSNPTDRTISPYSSSDVKKTLGLIYGIRGSVEYWDTFVAGSRDEIEEYQGDLEEEFSMIGLADDPSRLYLGYRSQHFVAAMKMDDPHVLYALRKPIEDTKEAIYTAFLPLGKDFLKAGESLSRKYRFYIGEKTETGMAKTEFAPLFDKYGEILGGIEKLLFETLKVFYGVTQNYGWAILCLTLLVKLILLPLNIKQTKSMAKMQEVQPELKKLQEKYKDDRQRLNAEMMKLYQVHQINPVAGCLPMILQLPIFFALFYTVGGSVEIYGEPFLWVKNLALADPTDILPIIFVGSFMISQRKMSSDPNQKMLIYILPVVFFFMMRNLSAGVMIYIVGQSLFSNIEQLIITAKKKSPSSTQDPPRGPQQSKKRKRKRNKGSKPLDTAKVR